MSIDKDSFAGYYSFSLPERCWDASGQRMINEENWASERFVTHVDVATKEVTKVVDSDGRKGAWLVLDVSHDIVVAQFSTPDTPPQLVSGLAAILTHPTLSLPHSLLECYPTIRPHPFPGPSSVSQSES